MVNKAPAFWWRKPGFVSGFLKPTALVYSYFASRNMEKSISSRIDLPVLCIGNFTLGGTGKTPVTIAFAQVARKFGYEPGIVSRGFGGSTHKDIHIIDVKRDCACEVGDEPLLLAKHAKSVVATDRYAAAKMLKETGCNIILMDDGFQSRRLYMDYTLLLIDAMRGFGNGEVFPAGPLRVPLSTQLAYTDGILIVGHGVKQNFSVQYALCVTKPIYHARLVSSANCCVEGRRFLAFTGIGHPQKFFASVKALGGILAEERIFADHHFFSEKDIKNIASSAKMRKLTIATTSKDYVRLKTNRHKDQLGRLVIFDVHVVFEPLDFCAKILAETITRYQNRASS